jgi:hypothetical protein
MAEKLTINESVMKKVEQAEKDALKLTADYVYRLLKEKIKEEAFDTWEFEKSLFVKIIGVGNIIQLWSRTPQAVVMEYGRRPLQKRPPMDALVPWAKRHNMISWWATNYKDLSSKDKSTVYLLSKAIGAKGITPRAIFRRVYELYSNQINEYFISVLKQKLWS